MNDLGVRGEDAVARYYESIGYSLVERNYFHPKGKSTGELDLIFKKGRLLVIVEVKARSSDKFGTPFDSVDQRKQRRLARTTKLFILTHPEFSDYDYRIDVAGVDIDNPGKTVKILENAVEDFE